MINLNDVSLTIQMLALIFGFLIALTIHEFFHAYIADRLGDPTAKLMGRVTLNPIAHFDPIGTLLPLVLIIFGSPFIFGWGKPVVVNPNNFKNPKVDNVTVSLAGPMSNFFVALLSGLLIRFTSFLPEILYIILFYIMLINIVFMVFNLIPIPPLDGSKLLSLFISEQAFMVLQQFGIFLLIMLILFINFTPIISKVVFFFAALITGKTIL